MRGAQRVIKYFATALAVVIIAMILLSVAGVGVMLSQIMGGVYDISTSTNDNFNTSLIEEGRSPRSLEIDVGLARVWIKEGARFRVEASEDEFDLDWQGERLRIEEREHGWLGVGKWWGQSDKDLVIYLPSGIEFRDVSIDAGVGGMQVERLDTERFDLNAGVGRTVIEDLHVRRITEIKGGAGVLEIRDGLLNGLDVDMGVGRMMIRAAVRGEAELKAGMGEMTLKLIGLDDDYNVVVDRGLGGVNWRGLSEGNSRGRNVINIEGGVGAINLELEREEN